MVPDDTASGSGDQAAEGLHDELVRRHVVQRTPRFRGRVIGVRTDVVELRDGHRVERDLVEHPGAVGVIAVDDHDNVLLVRQYRHPVGALLWEPPAGLLDVDGEAPQDAAARELYEEAGYRAASWAVLVDAFTSPGGSDEAVRLYLARELTAVPHDQRHVGEDEEHEMPTRWVPLAEARTAVLAGAVHNPLAVMGILAAAAVLLDAPSDGSLPTARDLRPTGSPWLRPVRADREAPS
jgi:8-oxo-dGTP pyrophosphatase MutT (NUDIX family)